MLLLMLLMLLLLLLLLLLLMLCMLLLTLLLTLLLLLLLLSLWWIRFGGRVGEEAEAEERAFGQAGDAVPRVRLQAVGAVHA